MGWRLRNIKLPRKHKGDHEHCSILGSKLPCFSETAFNFPKTTLDHLTAHVLRGKCSFWMECSRIVLVLFMLLTGTYGRIQVYTEIQTRRNPYENWTLHRLNSHSSTHTPKYPGLTNNSALNARAFVPLLDDPQASRRQITRRVPFGEGNNWNSVDRISHVWTDYPKVLRQRQNRWRDARLSSLPPWYVNQYKRYPRDQPDPTHDGITRVPWNYQSKCRSCGRPLLQDSFCSDDFVIRAYVYKELNPSVGSSQFLMYIYEVYRDLNRQMRATEYRRVAFSCDRFHAGPITGEVYVITGLYIDGVPTVDSCSWKASWNTVTRQQKRYLRTKYSLFCGVCTIQRVLQMPQREYQRPDVCYVALSPNPNEMDCRDRFSLCRYQRNTRSCKFNARSSYDVCKKWLSKKA